MVSTQSDSTTTASTVRIGTAGLPHGMSRTKYFETLSFLEADVLLRGGIKPSVLKRWRSSAPDHCGFALIAEAHFDGLSKAVESAAILRADALVFRSPAGASPSARNRDDLAALFDAIPDEARVDTTLVWVPGGLWEADGARRFAEDHRVVAAEDPLRPDAEVAVSETAYFQLSGLGLARPRYSDDQLEYLAELASAADRAWVVFGNQDRWRDAKRLDQLLRS